MSLCNRNYTETGAGRASKRVFGTKIL